MIGKLLKTAGSLVKVPFAVAADAADVLLAGGTGGNTEESLDDLVNDISDLLDV